MEPRDYGIDHDEWQPDQEDNIKWTLRGEGKINILESPTGTGKTAVPRAIAYKNRKDEGCETIVLVKTKFLQEDNYMEGYGFIPLMGKANYKCVHAAALNNLSASECLHGSPTIASWSKGPGGRTGCPKLEECPWLLNMDRINVERGRGAVMNFALWAYERDNFSPSWVIADEAHQLWDNVIEWAGLEINYGEVKKFRLPEPPSISHSKNNSNSLEMISAWFIKVKIALETYREEELANSKFDKSHLQKARAASRLQNKIQHTHDALAIGRNGWFVSSRPRGRSKLDNKFVLVTCKPLSASTHFKSWIGNAESKLLMSATIGDFDTFCESLGLDKQDVRTRQVRSPWPVERRPIFDLGLPRLGQKSSANAWSLQAKRIADAINEVDPSWSGLIHVTSKEKARQLAERLNKYGLGDRIWIPPTGRFSGTDKQLSAWRDRKVVHPNSIAIAWAFQEGYDGIDERINIVAKVPYPYSGTEYEQARISLSRSLYNQRTATMLVQMLGRTRRGREEDYDTKDEMRSLVAIADGGWNYVKKWMSPDIVESIQKWR